MDTDGVPGYILSHFTPCLCKSSMFTLSVEGLRNLKRKRPPWPNMRSRMERKSVLFYPRLCTEWEVGMRVMRVCTLAGKGRRKGWRGQREREGGPRAYKALDSPPFTSYVLWLVPERRETSIFSTTPSPDQN